ncbi:MAG TPA: Type 1 glutamine amidotransferase-like domain-containing protein [Actinomycetota bacterium]|nr:Type 1 glutamine amidotransferase-like domain-containing protein [Actinomycetota bacterium]
MTGRLVGLLGSGEYLPWAAEVDRWLLDRASVGDGSVALLATAAAPEGDAMFDKWSNMGLEHYRTMGVPAKVVPLKTREDASREAILSGIDTASLVFFSGGNPAYLASTLRETPFWKRLMERVDEGAAVAGCSAGACLFGEVAPDPTKMGSPGEAFAPAGLAVFPGFAFGAHWDVLDSYYPDLRGLSIRSMPPGCRMVGIDENTAMAADDGTWTVFGAGGVHVYRSDEAITYTAGQTFTLP